MTGQLLMQPRRLLCPCGQLTVQSHLPSYIVQILKNKTDFFFSDW